MFRKSKMFKHSWTSLIFGLLFLWSPDAVEGKSPLQISGKLSVDSLESIRHSTNCKQIVKVIECYYQFPEGLLRAIGMVESRLHPWVVCIGRRGITFRNRKQTEAYLQKLIDSKRGLKDFYVGCMQISYLSHHRKFCHRGADLLNPFDNIHYAARLLKLFYRRYGSWEKAVQMYHSGSSFSSRHYSQKVFRMWKKISPVGELQTLSWSVS
jgi:hypothetical protein